MRLETTRENCLLLFSRAKIDEFKQFNRRQLNNWLSRFAHPDRDKRGKVERSESLMKRVIESCDARRNNGVDCLIFSPDDCSF